MVSVKEVLAIAEVIKTQRKTVKIFSPKFLRDNISHRRLRQGIYMDILNSFRKRRKLRKNDGRLATRGERLAYIRGKIIAKFRETAFQIGQ